MHSTIRYNGDCTVKQADKKKSLSKENTEQMSASNMVNFGNEQGLRVPAGDSKRENRVEITAARVSTIRSHTYVGMYI